MSGAAARAKLTAHRLPSDLTRRTMLRYKKRVAAAARLVRESDLLKRAQVELENSKRLKLENETLRFETQQLRIQVEELTRRNQALDELELERKNVVRLLLEVAVRQMTVKHLTQHVYN